MKTTLVSAFGVIFVAASPLACSTSPGGPTLVDLGVFATPPSGLEERVLCVTLPVLLGSHVTKSGTADGAFDVTVDATRDAATVAFARATVDGASPLSIDAEELRQGFSRQVTVHTDAADYLVRLSSDCGSNGAISSGGTSGTGGAGGAGGIGGDGGTTGAGGAMPTPLGVSSMTPSSGPYGTEVVVQGSGFGAASGAVALLLGDDQSVSLSPSSRPEVTSWTDSEIRFRVPFPVEGAVTLEGESGSVSAGSFSPTWIPGPPSSPIGAVHAVASLSARAGHVAVVLDTTPPTLVQSDAAGWSTSTIDVTDVRLDSLRLYLAGNEMRGFVLSSADPPEIVALATLTASGDKLLATPTGVLASADYAVAGGPSGGTIWFSESGQWRRARPSSSGTWKIDKGPVADPNPGAPLHAAGASSDGSLYIAWSKDTGTLLDDMAAPYMQTLSGSASTFDPAAPAGASVDDYLTSLSLEGRGDGLIVRYCGSNVDPFGLSGTDYLCYDALHSGSAVVLETGVESDAVRYSLRGSSIGAVLCDEVTGVRVVPDWVTESSTPSSSPDIAVWPCSPIFATEFDGQGIQQPLFHFGSSLYAPRVR